VVKAMEIFIFPPTMSRDDTMIISQKSAQTGNFSPDPLSP
jgi:hypothetical protein